MLIGLLVLLILAVIVFGILGFVVGHLFWIGLIIAAIFLIAHSGFMARRHA